MRFLKGQTTTKRIVEFRDWWKVSFIKLNVFNGSLMCWNDIKRIKRIQVEEDLVGMLVG